MDDKGDDHRSLCLHDAMDELWFRGNILFLQTSIATSASLDAKMHLFPERSGSLSKLPSDDKKSEPVNQEGGTLFQLQPKRLRRMRGATRSCRSSSENYELKGFMDTGFSFPGAKLRPSTGFQRLRPSPSEAWFVNRSNSLLLDLQMLPKSPEGVERKKHIRFWAREVASLIQGES